MGIEAKFLKACRKLGRAGGSNIVSELQQVLNSLLPQPFRVNVGIMVAEVGAQMSGRLMFVHTSDTKDGAEIQSKEVAAVVHISEVMDLQTIREAYSAIAEAKKIKGLHIQPLRSGTTSSALGIIFAVNASVTLERLARELEGLNQSTSSQYWPDMIVILSQGIINYGVQFPRESVSGEFLPAEPGSLSSYIPAIYIIMLINPTAEYTLNKMCSLLIAQFRRFLPQENLPDWKALMSGFSEHALTLTGYQYNLAGNLVTVPRNLYNDRYLPPRALRIEDQNGELLSTIAFIPWQEGGVVLLTGRLPLEGLLIFIEGAGTFSMGVTRRPQTQISHVLPINQTLFMKLLQNIQQRSNMVVKEDETQTVMQKLADEGTISPFISRLFVGILNLRDRTTLSLAERAEFDRIYDSIIRGLFASRTASKRILEIYVEHAKRVADGSIIKFAGTTVHIEESIDPQLGKGSK